MTAMHINANIKSKSSGQKTIRYRFDEGVAFDGVEGRKNDWIKHIAR